RNAKDPQLFTEFSESQTEMSHRAQASRLPEEIKLEKRLQGLGIYAPDAWELWTEVSLATPTEASRAAMAGRPIVVAGETWAVAPAGRVTVSARDQFAVVFEQ